MSFSLFCSDLHTKINSLKHVALIAHRSPDGDACGSLAGLAHLLRDNYPELTISVVVPPEKNTDTHINWVLGQTVDNIPEDAELVLLLDTSLLSRTSLSTDSYPTQAIISIDHHEFLPGSIDGYRDTDAPSTTLILTDIARELDWKISAETATALLLGIYTDTG
jgi:bifunctional oligoribonuclease and PAP phosphatase NrnA